MEVYDKSNLIFSYIYWWDFIDAKSLGLGERISLRSGLQAEFWIGQQCPKNEKGLRGSILRCVKGVWK